MHRLRVRQWLALWSLAAGTASAQSVNRTVWDGAYTAEQAARGVAAYDRSCSRCHSLETGGNLPLVGDVLWKGFSQKTVGDLLEFVSRNMPNGAGGSLPADAYRDIVALMLKSNGFPAGAVELGEVSSLQVRIVPKDGSSALPANALGRIIGCLERNGSGWVVTSATSPQRAEGTHDAGADAARALGSRRMELKFVLTRLDAMLGSRVVVTGILIGADGVDGINVTTVNRVADKCP